MPSRPARKLATPSPRHSRLPTPPRPASPCLLPATAAGLLHALPGTSSPAPPLPLNGSIVCEDHQHSVVRPTNPRSIGRPTGRQLRCLIRAYLSDLISCIPFHESIDAWLVICCICLVVMIWNLECYWFVVNCKLYRLCLIHECFLIGTLLDLLWR